MRNEQGHPHAESMKLYAEDAMTTDTPWQLWQLLNEENVWQNLSCNPIWSTDLEYRRKPKEPELIQGYTKEQWQQVAEGEFLCEFADDPTFKDAIIGTLSSLKTSNFPKFCAFGLYWSHCRPLRTKGVKQPWFGGRQPLSDPAKVVIYLRDGSVIKSCAGDVLWAHAFNDQNIIAFIEL